MKENVYNVNIISREPLVSPEELKLSLPIDEIHDTIMQFRNEVEAILAHRDPRMLIIVGPCSIHDREAALDYARRLKVLRERYKETLNIVMRVYFEKPRTTLGWRGFVIDPGLDDSYKINEGLTQARRLLIDIARMEIPAGTEVLDPIIPQYISDLISWASIGARTTESQTHREIASGLSMPVGFKNGTDGDLTKAINAVQSARHSHSFIGIEQSGKVCVFNTRGNRTGHIIIRGGKSGPNYHEEDIERAENLLAHVGILPSIIIDCSHANSGKQYYKQARVLKAALRLREQGRTSIRGIMLESNLVAGRQDIPEDKTQLVYGQSITDACIGWEETEELLDMVARYRIK
ncbi:MAG: 3-deoxy-7-phosphoheptulonate synthase [Spirochaeta sp. LUC14_002_19_P3]|nr:MAG: 3-deoxy-7-phosphoheptulonate synthase [Spirochaeta sp. LUC14_002_19_P3]